MGLDGRACLGDLDDGVGQVWWLDFGRAPAEFDGGFDAVLGQVALGHADSLGGDAFAGQVLGAVNVGVVGRGQHPTQGLAADFAVNEFGDFHDVGAIFDDPVMAGEAAVKQAFLDVAGHLLGADEHAFDFLVVDGRVVGAGLDVDFVAGAAEHIDGGFFQAAFG